MKARKRLDPGAYRLPRAWGIDEHAAIGMRGEYQRASVFKQRVAMARGNSDATFCVERDDRRSVKRCAHMAFCATFSYLLPLYWQNHPRVKPFFPVGTKTYGAFRELILYNIVLLKINGLNNAIEVDCKELGYRSKCDNS